jgi:hypothetical protein
MMYKKALEKQYMLASKASSIAYSSMKSSELIVPIGFNKASILHTIKRPCVALYYNEFPRWEIIQRTDKNRP